MGIEPLTSLSELLNVPHLLKPHPPCLPARAIEFESSPLGGARRDGLYTPPYPEPFHPTGYNPHTMCLAAPARVLSITENVATVDYGGVETRCRLDTLTEEVAVGDYVLIHTGFAIRRLSPEDGEETLRLFDELAASLEAENPGNAELDSRSAVGDDEPS